MFGEMHTGRWWWSVQVSPRSPSVVYYLHSFSNPLSYAAQAVTDARTYNYRLSLFFLYLHVTMGVKTPPMVGPTWTRVRLH